ncbi:MAG: Stp1/IreP family PP2C-type Ser/Thr phosphatase [Bdellovibrionales bacterium]|nr:Stp1/IreP family PP2C-type Ser/Thr phosphatase [Bdellovibrionales bacterium]
MRFEVWAQTDVGLKRDINQDAILVDHDSNLFIVADGMGGHKGGEVASALAVETVQEIIAKRRVEPKQSPRKVLSECYREASSRIHHKSTHESPDLMGMGTTMVLFWEFKGRIYIGNVGDSRCYVFIDQNMWQLTEDHSLINEQVRAGVISEEEAPHVVGRNVITRSVGFERDVMVDVLEREPTPGETYLLCSDGLSGLVTPERMLEIFLHTPIEDVVAKCIKEAKAAGGDDNISVIVIRPKNAG